MKSIFLVTFLVLFYSAMSDDLVQQTCRKAAVSDKNLNYNFCVATLHASSRSRGSDLAGLIILTLDLTTAKDASIKATIAKLLKDPKSVKDALKDCAELYADASYNLHEAIIAFKSKDYGTANARLSASLNAPDTCEEGFKEKKSASPLNKEDADFTQLNIMCLAFINQLSGV